MINPLPNINGYLLIPVKHVKHKLKFMVKTTSKMKTTAGGKFLGFKCKFSSTPFSQVFNFHHSFQPFFLCNILLSLCHLFPFSCFSILSTKQIMDMDITHKKKTSHSCWNVTSIYAIIINMYGYGLILHRIKDISQKSENKIVFTMETITKSAPSINVYLQNK